MSRYSHLLPMRDDVTVKEQFGWLPVSVFRPGKGKNWESLVGDNGDTAGNRRSNGCKYLPSLRYSKFNPELAETVIRYWSVAGDLVVDPFAGRATRGVVATVLGRYYIGYDVVPDTVQAVKERLSSQSATGIVYLADGCKMSRTPDNIAGLVFTCPPYHRVERYASSLNQLSDITSYELFLERITECAKNIYRVLQGGRFLVWVCADWRDGKAFRLFHKDSLDIFSGVGLTPHDIVIMENISPFAPLQAGKVAAKRYTSKVHEYLLVFRKDGDGNAINGEDIRVSLARIIAEHERE